MTQRKRCKVFLDSNVLLSGLFSDIAEKDVPVLASAIACGAEYLITGDKKDFAKLRNVKKYNLKIVSLSEFIETVFPEIIKEAQDNEAHE